MRTVNKEAAMLFCEDTGLRWFSAVMGKMESSPKMYEHSEHYLPFHAHITALTVAPPSRRLGLAKLLTGSLERAGDEYNAWFVDLFVRKSNKVATDMYRGMG